MLTKKQGRRGASFFSFMTSLPAFFLLSIVCLFPVTGPVDSEAYDAGPPITVTTTPVKIVSNDSGYAPHVDANLLTYSKWVNGMLQARYFNIVTNIESGIPTTGYDYFPGVSGNIIVFSRLEASMEAAIGSIWTFDASTAGPAIELAPGPGVDRRGGVIGGPTVAWQNLVFGTGSTIGSDVVAYDRPTGTVTWLTNDAESDSHLAVSPDGNVVVWDKRVAISNSLPDIWQAVKGQTGWTVSQVTNTADDERFADTNGNLVVYGGNRAGSITGPDIYWKPVAGGAEEHLAMDDEQRAPAISGNVIAFQSRDFDVPTPNWDIYLYDLSTSILYRMTDTPIISESELDISTVGSQFRVVWSVNEVIEGTSYNNIYAATLSFPVANAGPDQIVNNGDIVTLDGSASSDPDQNYPLSYEWTITSAPVGSTATLSDPAVVNPTFIADLRGDYTLKLVVKDSAGFFSVLDSVTISAANPDPFAFTDQFDAALNIVVQSNPIIVSGLSSPANVSISVCTSAACEYRINNGGWASNAGLVSNGDTVMVRQTSSGSYSVITTARLTIGSVSDTFSVTTAAPSSGVVPPGTNVESEPAPGIDMTFDTVTTGGNVTATQNTNPSPPANFMIPSGSSYEITFTGTFTGPVTICITYDEGEVGNENNLKLMHRGPQGWEDITTSLDTLNNIICGETTSFSEFAVMESLVNTPPVPSMTVAQSGWTVTVTDSSTDAEDAQSALSVTVDWGTGTTPSTGNGGSTFTHTYTVAGNYVIKHKVKDTAGVATWSANASVYVPVKYSVSGKITRSNGTTAISGATLYLRKTGTTTKTNAAFSRTNGTYTFSGVAPGTYDVIAIKAGYTFVSPAFSGVVVTDDVVTGIDISSIAP
jgi:hypothetical protein